MKKCKSCPMLITTEEGEKANDFGCLPSVSEAIKYYKDTGKMWACHDTTNTPCVGLIVQMKRKGIEVNPNAKLITEETTLEQIYFEEDEQPPIHQDSLPSIR